MKIATIGFFDGVHKGHQFLFGYLRREAQARGAVPLIVTFEHHPREVLQADYVPRLLTTAGERRELLSAYGEVAMLPFEEVQALTAAQFMVLLRERYDVHTIVMGYDHRFGSDRLRSPQDYRRAGAMCGMEVQTLNEYMEGEWHVSSTEIRSALENGNIALANELLGRPYALSGNVVHGKAVGRTIGFPTANIVPSDPHKIIPKAGVYMANVNTPAADNASAIANTPAFVNIGTNPTVNAQFPTGSSPLSIEAHIPSFKGDLYGRQLELRFIRYIREERQFDTIEGLREQIKADIDSILRPEA